MFSELHQRALPNLEREHGKTAVLAFSVLFDNCPAHSSSEDVIDEFSELVPRKVAPYSPEMNVIELRFFPLKAEITKRFRALGPVEAHVFLDESLTACGKRLLLRVATESVTSSKILQAFGHFLLQVLPKVLRLEDI